MKIEDGAHKNLTDEIENLEVEGRNRIFEIVSAKNIKILNFK